MKCRLLSPTLVLVIMLCSMSQAKLVQWSSDVGGNDHFYEVISVPSGISWHEANNSATSSGGYLATITSAAENSFIYNLLDYGMHFIGEWDWGPWLGGYQPAGSPEPYGGWRWVTGEPFTYTNWKPGNPDNYDGIEDYLHFLQGPEWNDIAPYGAWNSIPLEAYIVEYNPPPSTLFVDARATGASNGSSWLDAFADVQKALTVATAFFPQVEEIRVAQGAYSPEGPLPDIRKASNPNPPDGAGVSYLDADLSWTPGIYATSHDVYFGTTKPPPFMQNQTAATFDPSTMAYGTKYYWRIDEVGPSGTTTGAIWSFSTISAPPPMGSNESLDNTVTVLDRTATFQLINGVVIKGGYAGFGEPDPNARDIEVYETILSGDIGILGDISDNSYHVVTGSGTYETAVLDGFTITGGNANGSFPDNCGGGMHNWYNGSPTVTNCTFSNNSGLEGGGIYNHESSSPTLTNCTFRGNSAEWGGGIYNLSSSPTLTNCTFSGNSAEWGGGMHNTGEASPTLTNCTFSGNSANDGGGMANIYSSPTLTNCILWGNTATSGPQIHNYDGTSSATVSYSNVQGDWPGEGNIDADPCFVDPGYWDPSGLWIEGDYHLLQTSACINAGDNNNLPADTQDLDGDGNTAELIPFDIEGTPRIVYDVVDMGPYEFENTAPIADAGPDQIVECACNTEGGTKVTLDGTNSSDPDRGVLTYTWTGPFIESSLQGAAPTVTLEDGCPGEYVITLVVNDGIEDSEPNEVVITVVDTTPPDFNLSVAPTVLWPPNHEMVEITPSLTVSDKCDPAPDVSLVSIVANEGDDIIGDGHTTNDIQIGDDGSIYVRAERSGPGIGRIYTITYQAVDDFGNVTVRSATVGIPHELKFLARISHRWLWRNHTVNLPEDLNGDGIVNLEDFAIFAAYWIQ